jgi:urease accessory protein
MNSPQALLRLLQLASPALPVGAYAYSQGLEYAVQEGWVRSEGEMLSWLRGVAGRGMATLELPLLLRLRGAWERADRAAVQRWNERLVAARATRESRAEDLQMGRSLLRILGDLGLQEARQMRETAAGYATAFALAAARWEIGASETLYGYLWSWTENQVLAAVKLVPLGQSAGQRLLHGFAAEMPALIERACSTGDEHIGSSAVSQALASALHETQYSRLFRS